MTPPNTWFLGPTRVLNQNGISIGSAVFAQLTPERPYLTMGHPPPENCPFPWGSGPHLIHDSLGPFEPITQTASGLVQRDARPTVISPATEQCHCSFCTTHRGVSLCFTMGRPFPLKIAPSHERSGSHLINGSLGPPQSSTQTASRSVQLFLQARTTVTDRLTETTLLRLYTNRPDLRRLYRT